jgi:hypothetical protein
LHEPWAELAPDRGGAGGGAWIARPGVQAQPAVQTQAIGGRDVVVFVGRLGPHGEPDVDDELSFEHGQFWSSSCVRSSFDFGSIDLRPSNEPVVHRMLMKAAVVYALASAWPFVPGAEIGVGHLLVSGGELAVPVYGGRVGARLLAYGVGRLVPMRSVAAALRACGLDRAHALLPETEGLDRRRWLAPRVRNAPRRIVPLLVRHRRIALALLLNLPGNALLGGGGGIALPSGTNRLFGLPRHAATVALAVAPVSGFFAIFG